MSMRGIISRFGTMLSLATIAVLAIALRWTTFTHPIWNLDESIHAAVARVLLDGGVLYRDAIDQRTPLTYEVMAGLFAAFGANNLWAAHAFLSLLVAATAGLLYLLLRRQKGWWSGWWAAALYLLLGTGMYYQGDANAYVTEWFVAFFSTAAAWLFWQPAWQSDRWRGLTIGALLNLAFLSKQPALLDLAPPLLVGAWCLWEIGEGWRKVLFERCIPLLVGWTIPLAVTVIYFAWHGALGDYVFYTWTYNLSYYGPELSLDDRIGSLRVPIKLLLTYSPALTCFLGIMASRALYLLCQREPRPEERRQRAFLLYLLIWVAAAIAAGASGGRGFDHYFIQALPSICLLLGWILGGLIEEVLTGNRPRLLRAGLGLLLVILSGQIIHKTFRARERTLPDDPSLRAAQFIQSHSEPSDKIFVWGYHPDLYFLANRKPASRFIYCSFLTGMIPWSNVGPDRDTSYAIVPGAMEQLLADLERSRPTFVVDCSAGQNRFWQKYPLEKFPALQNWLLAHYVLAEQAQFVPQGFRLFLIKDVYRHSIPTSPPDKMRIDSTIYSEIAAPHFVEAKPGLMRIVGRDPSGQLTRLALQLEGRDFASVSCPPCTELSVSVMVPFEKLGGARNFQSLIVTRDGRFSLSAIHQTDTRKATASPQELAAFSLPLYANSLAPIELSAPFGAQAQLENGSAIYFAHAPSRLVYELPAGTYNVRGAMGFRQGAYALTNPTPTDGAEFRIEIVKPDGGREVILRRLLQPLQIPADRALVPFNVTIPRGAAGHLEFIIDPGPAGNASSDWTYWADLALATSR